MFKPLFPSIRDLLARWNHNWISWLGLIASVKMTILPKLFYCLATLPIPLPSTQLGCLQMDLLNFVWDYKKNRVDASVIFASRLDGGLSFPNLLHYFNVSQLKEIASWVTLSTYNLWTEIMGSSCPFEQFAVECGRCSIFLLPSALYGFSLQFVETTETKTFHCPMPFYWLHSCSTFLLTNSTTSLMFYPCMSNNFIMAI